MPPDPGAGAVGPPDPETISKLIRDLGVDPATVAVPAAPRVPDDYTAVDDKEQARRTLLDKAAEARKKLMGEP